MQNVLRVAASGLAAAVSTGALFAQGCNARSQALEMFSRQGLNLLQPARDYIKPGGMIFLSKKTNRPDYESPKDPISPEPGNLVDFRAVILKETDTRSGAFSAALALANQILPIPIGLTASDDQAVTLDTIETTGLRLETDPLDKLIQERNTSAAARAGLKTGRVFVIQEVYSARSLSLKSTNSRRLAVSLNGNQPVPTCGASPGSGKSGDAGSGPGAAGSGDAEAASGSQPRTGDTGAASGTAKTAAAAKPTTASAAMSAASQIGASVGICRANEFTLQMKTDKPIPFAVRLAEVELSGGAVQRKRGAESIKNTTLGGGEIAAALVAKSAPVLALPKTPPRE